MYAALAVLAIVENIFPPVPADLAVALGAFLSHRGVIDAFTVFLVCWIANVSGAVGVYFMARRFGGSLFGTPIGRRILSPEAIARVERGYIRYGLPGIFLGRLLPGIRAVVAPFVGLLRLPPARAILPIAIASAIWYGVVTWIGRYLGGSWERIERIIGQLNATLAIVAAALVAGGVVWAWRARLARKARRRRLWEALQGAIEHAHTPGTPEPALQAVATFVLELAHADEQLAPPAREALSARLRDRFRIRRRPAGLQRAELEEATLRAATTYGAEQRKALVERMRHVAGAAEAGGEAEEAMIRRAAELLGVEA